MLTIKGLKPTGGVGSGSTAVVGGTAGGAPSKPAGAKGVPRDRKPGSKVHVCIKCDTPIAVYGVLHPCKHAFCFSCATEMGSTCYLCFRAVDEIRRVDASHESLVMCGVCLTSYESIGELQAKILQQGGAGACCMNQPKPVETFTNLDMA